MLARRAFFLFLAVSLAAPLTLQSTPVLAKDGDGGGSGHDGGGDDDGGDDDGGDDSSARAHAYLSQDEALKARKAGKIIALSEALKSLQGKARGTVIDVKLSRGMGGFYYRLKIRNADGAINTIRIDARTGRVLGLLGL